MVEYCEEDLETLTPPPGKEVEIETLKPPPAEYFQIKSPLPPTAEEVEIQSLIAPSAEEVQIQPLFHHNADEVQIQSLFSPSAEEVQVQILDVDCYDSIAKRRKMARDTKAYCLSCRKKTSMQRPRLVKMKKGQRLAGSCKTCSTKTSLIIGKNHILAVK